MDGQAGGNGGKCPVMHGAGNGAATAHGAAHGGTHGNGHREADTNASSSAAERRSPRAGLEPRLWPNALTCRCCTRTRPEIRWTRLRLRAAVRDLDVPALQRELAALMRLAGSGGPPTMATTVRSSCHGVAQRRHVPHGRWPRWRVERHAAVRALNSWPDNGNSTRRVACVALKQKYGKQLRADLMIFAADVCRDHGFTPFGSRSAARRCGRPRSIYWRRGGVLAKSGGEGSRYTVSASSRTRRRSADVSST